MTPHQITAIVQIGLAIVITWGAHECWKDAVRIWPDLADLFSNKRNRP